MIKRRCMYADVSECKYADVSQYEYVYVSECEYIDMSEIDRCVRNVMLPELNFVSRSRRAMMRLELISISSVRSLVLISISAVWLCRTISGNAED